MEKFLQKYMINRMILKDESPLLMAMSFGVTPMLCIYTPQIKLRVTLWTFPCVVYWVSYVAQPDKVSNTRFSVSLKGVENKAFPVKNLASKIVFNSQFWPLFLKKIIFYHFIDNWSLFIFDNCIHIVLVYW